MLQSWGAQLPQSPLSDSRTVGKGSCGSPCTCCLRGTEIPHSVWSDKPPRNTEEAFTLFAKPLKKQHKSKYFLELLYVRPEESPFEKDWQLVLSKSAKFLQGVRALNASQKLQKAQRRRLKRG